jgi:hypothetical protein
MGTIVALGTQSARTSEIGSIVHRTRMALATLVRLIHRPKADQEISGLSEAVLHDINMDRGAAQTGTPFASWQP